MTRDILNDTALDTVSGGLPSLNLTSTIAKPNIPRDKDLLTPEQIAKIFTVGINFPPPRSAF